MKLQKPNTTRKIDFPHKFKVGDYVEVACCFHGPFPGHNGSSLEEYKCNSEKNVLEFFAGKRLKVVDICAKDNVFGNLEFEYNGERERSYWFFFELAEPKEPLTYGRALKILAEKNK